MTPKRFNILGVGISVLNLEDATRKIQVRLESDSDPASYVCVTGVHGIIEAQDNKYLRDIFNRSFLTLSLIHI